MTVPAQTFLELQDAALHDDFDPTKYRARAKIVLNEALGRIGRRVYALQQRSTATIATTAGDNAYPLPADFVRAVSFRDPARHPGDLDEVDPQWIDDQDTSLGVPAVYAIDGLQLLLWPAPANAVDLALRYWSTPTAMSDDTDTPNIPTDYVDLLVTYARAKLFLLEDDKAMHDGLMNDFNNGILDARADLQHTSLRRVRQVPSMWGNTSRPRFAKP